jgi:hypothetical protein
MGAIAVTGPSSSAASYLQATAGSSASFTSVLTTGDLVSLTGGTKASTYQMAGIPDGLGAYDNYNGTFTVLMNHELGNTLGAVHAQGAVGSFVSEWIINKTDLSVVSGRDMIQKVVGWDSANQKIGSVLSSGSAALSFQRLCSADMAAVSAFSYTSTSGVVYGTANRLFLTGEESTGSAAVPTRGMAVVATGADKGTGYELGKLGTATDGSGRGFYPGYETLAASPFSQQKTVVIGNNDGGTGLNSQSIGVYVGTKTNTGNDIERAGLTNGVLKFVNVAGNTTEITDTTNRTTGITSGTSFTLSNTAATAFSRPEDGAWSADGKTYYFVTTDRLDTTELSAANALGNPQNNTQKGGTRLWSLSFDDMSNPDAGGKIKKLFDSTSIAGGLGNQKPNMFDNISVNKDGSIYLQEDAGGANHNGKVWQYNPTDGSMVLVAKFDPTLFGDVNPATGSFTAGSHTNDEESSGIIDITDILGRNDGKQYSLLVAQDHASAAKLGLPQTLAEGGQLLVMAAAPVPEPETYAMLLAGLGLVGSIVRRKKAKTA